MKTFEINDNTNLETLIKIIKEDDLKTQKENAEAKKPKPKLEDVNYINKSVQKSMYNQKVKTWEQDNFQKSIKHQTIFVKTKDKPVKELINFFVTVIAETKCTGFTIPSWTTVKDEDIAPIVNAAKNNPYFQGFSIKFGNELLDNELNKYPTINEEINKFIISQQ